MSSPGGSRRVRAALVATLVAACYVLLLQCSWGGPAPMRCDGNRDFAAIAAVVLNAVLIASLLVERAPAAVRALTLALLIIGGAIATLVVMATVLAAIVDSWNAHGMAVALFSLAMHVVQARNVRLDGQDVDESKQIHLQTATGGEHDPMNAQETLATPYVPVAPRPAEMSAVTRGSLRVLGAAALLGGLGDALLRQTPWGLNLTLWTLVLIAAVVTLRRREGLELAGRAWIPLALLATVLMTWRDSPTLKALDLGALCVVLGLAMYRASGGRVRAAGVLSYVKALAVANFEALAGAPSLVVEEVKWGELGGGRGGRYALPLARGLALALPLLGIFAALLMSADERFAGMVSSAFQLDAVAVTRHIMTAGAFAWLTAGVLRVLARRDAPPSAETPIALPLSLGMVEVGTVLGLLNVLFLAFVIVQLPYLFGTAAAGGAVGYAHYARRGFFELVWVAGLVLPLLLGLHHALRRDNPANERWFRWLAGGQVALLFVIIASALHRMRLYQNAYGLTELRLYTTAFMLWLALVFAWFCVTVLRGQRERFAFGALLVAADVLVLLHAVNPDARIVRTNAARIHAEARFDTRYAAGLSADAVPPLVAALAKAPLEDRCEAARRLDRRWGVGADVDWRSWSVARQRARNVVRARAATLRAGCPADIPQTVASALR